MSIPVVLNWGWWWAMLPPQETVAIPGDICDWELVGRGALLASDLKK